MQQIMYTAGEMSMIYHVTKYGDDYNVGSKERPFLTIQKAANVAVAGDTIVVHEGIYREWVKPVNGGLAADKRIVYQAAEGEKVIIKGSEIVKGWEEVSGTVWKAVVSNTLFGDFNPFEKTITGDWIVFPYEDPVHLGEVYLNGRSFYEAKSLEEVCNPQRREKVYGQPFSQTEEAGKSADMTLYQWYAEVEREDTIIYANFHGADPNEECVEINVRKCCFFPETTGLNYITVQGFEMAQAATSWAPPTAEQVGIIGPNWSKGWIIENNIFHDAKCSAVCLGKEKTTGDNNFTKWRRKPGYQYQMEAVFLARNIGWSKERIGSHIVRNNIIYDCGQNGVVGHMGCAFSEIYGNEIYRIGIKREYFGWEIAAIKFHAAIDVQIYHNYIHHSLEGLWLDWQAQGTRVSGNIFDCNAKDIKIEVSHGPCLVDNNIFTGDYFLENVAQGSAFVHNLCGGYMRHWKASNRATPYHLPHSTDLLGTTLVYGNDDRWFRNIFIGGDKEDEKYGTADYDGAPVSLEEYIERVRALGEGDVEKFEKVEQPAYISGNVYLNGAKAFDREAEYYADAGKEVNPGLYLEDKAEGVYLHITLPEEIFAVKTDIVDSGKLGMTRLTEERFESPEGRDIVFDTDFLGQKRGEKPVVGPIEGLTAGENVICIWERN